MILIRVKPVDSLVKAIFPLTRIATQGDIHFSNKDFTITVIQHHPRFITILQMTSDFFHSFLVTRNLNARLCLDTFHTSLLESKTFPSITIHFLQDQLSLLLRTQDPNGQLPEDKMLQLLPSEVEDVPNIDYTNSVMIESRDFRRIVQKELSFTYRDKICVTLAGSQLKFSTGAKQSILNEKNGQCIVVRPEEGGAKNQFEFILHPMSFYNDLIDMCESVWFFKTVNSETIISFSLRTSVRYLMYFPKY